MQGLLPSPPGAPENLSNLDLDHTLYLHVVREAGQDGAKSAIGAEGDDAVGAGLDQPASPRR